VSEKRVRAYRHGLFAETIAALLLRLKGHRIIARRYKTPVGEIDLVALKGKRLAFVEVKQRKTFDEAGWSLPTRARRRIVRAAQYWLAGHPDFCRPRHRLRRGAGGALGLVSIHRKRLSGLTKDSSLPGLTRQSTPVALRFAETSRHGRQSFVEFVVKLRL
jgi:putative endonuclease